MPTIEVNGTTHNVYADVSEADSYLSGRLYTDAWDDADEADKQAALITATRTIDRLTLVGRPADDDQALAFPRTIRATDGSDVDTDDIPQAVADATVEEALALLDRGNSERRKLQADGVTSFQIGSLSESYANRSIRTGSPIKPQALASLEARELMRPWIAKSVRIV